MAADSPLPGLGMQTAVPARCSLQRPAIYGFFHAKYGRNLSASTMTRIRQSPELRAEETAALRCARWHGATARLRKQKKPTRRSTGKGSHRRRPGCDPVLVKPAGTLGGPAVWWLGAVLLTRAIWKLSQPAETKCTQRPSLSYGLGQITDKRDKEHKHTKV